MIKRLSIFYWLRKILVMKPIQLILVKIFFLRTEFIRKLVFKLIYKTNHWNKYKSIDKHNLLVSGPGSIPGSKQTKNVIANLHDFIRKNNIKTMLDMPCGDFSWMQDLIKLNNNIVYTGYDIVDEIVQINNKKYSSSNIKFIQRDIVNEFNFDGFDLVFIRDFFIHISNNEIIKVINSIKNSKIKFFACLSHNNELKNKDIAIGQHRRINLLISPFNLNSVYYKFSEEMDDRYVNFYKIN
jgi:hypothetical protein